MATQSLMLSSADAAKLREQATEAVENNTKSILLLANILWNTYRYNVKFRGIDSPLWVAWGHSTWLEYVEHELGIHKSTAIAFRRIHEVFSIELKGCWNYGEFSQLSATKLRALCKVVNKKNVNGWIRRAIHLSCCQLDEAILVSQNGGIRSGAIHTLTIPCTSSEQKKMRGIISEAKTTTGLDRPGSTLLRILQEWSAFRTDQELRHTKKVAS